MKAQYTHKKIAMILATTLSLSACILPEDESPDPNDDSVWSLISGTSGLNGNWALLEDGTADTMVCESSIDVDGDGNDDSRRATWSFDETASTATLKAQVYLDSTDCDSGSPNFDYSDEIHGDYTQYSSFADFNRIDLEITSIYRQVSSADGKILLDDNSACGISDWVIDNETDVADCTDSDDLNIAGFSHNSDGVVINDVGDILKGVFHVEGGNMGLEVGTNGNRPDGTTVSTFNYFRF